MGRKESPTFDLPKAKFYMDPSKTMLHMQVFRSFKFCECVEVLEHLGLIFSFNNLFAFNPIGETTNVS